MTFTNIFSQLLNATTNSYKHLFLQAVVERIAQGQSLISLSDLTTDMLVNSWYPNQYFKLSFGTQDQIGKVFDSCEFEISIPTSITSPGFKEQLRGEIVKHIDVSETQKLIRYVQYRILTPFFNEELRGKKDGVKNALIAKLTDVKFNTIRPLYKINNDGSIEVHPDWKVYISQNLSVLKDFLKLQWAQYLQKNNPNVPSVLNKTEPPIKRTSLKQQTNYWNRFLDLNPSEKCIYTDDTLSTIKISIDHFLPWSFVCHDRLWNLIPVNARTNSSKSNNLPDLDKYLPPFIEQQHKAISTHSSLDKNWKKYGEIYLQDLNFKNYQELLNEQEFESRLSQTIQIQYSLAKQLGFKQNWNFSPFL